MYSVVVFIYLPLVYHLLLLCFSHSLCTWSSIYTSFHVYTCSPFVFNLFSLHSVHSLPYTFVFHLSSFTLPLILPYLPHLFSICFSFVFHLFFIHSPFLFSPHSLISRSRMRFVRGQGRKYRFVARNRFSSSVKFPRSRRIDVKAECKVSAKRLCSSLLLLQGSCSYPNRNARTPTLRYSSSSASYTLAHT